jgi:hypothetical protein
MAASAAKAMRARRTTPSRLIVEITAGSSSMLSSSDRSTRSGAFNVWDTLRFVFNTTFWARRPSMRAIRTGKAVAMSA